MKASKNLFIRTLVNDHDYSHIDALEVSRMIFGIPLEHGEGYDYQNQVMAGCHTNLQLDYYNGMQIINVEESPAVKPKYEFDLLGNKEWVEPKKCWFCEHKTEKNTCGLHLQQKEIDIAALKEFYPKSVEDTFISGPVNNEDHDMIIFEAPHHNCIADTLFEYVLPQEILKFEQKQHPATWISRMIKVTLAEAIAISEDLDMVCGSSKEAKLNILKNWNSKNSWFMKDAHDIDKSWQLCILAFELKQLEPTRSIVASEAYTEYFETSDEADEYGFFEFSEEADQMRLELEAESKDMQKTFGVKQYGYKKLCEDSIPDRGIYNHLDNMKDLFEFVKKYPVKNWDEYTLRKKELTNAIYADADFVHALEWAKNNKKQAKRKLSAITYRGEEAKPWMTPDRMHQLWQAVK